MYIVKQGDKYLKLFSNGQWTDNIDETPKYKIEQIAIDIAKQVNGEVKEISH